MVMGMKRMCAVLHWNKNWLYAAPVRQWWQGGSTARQEAAPEPVRAPTGCASAVMGVGESREPPLGERGRRHRRRDAPVRLRVSGRGVDPRRISRS
jgi:hypothetical protein